MVHPASLGPQPHYSSGPISQLITAACSGLFRFDAPFIKVVPIQSRGISSAMPSPTPHAAFPGAVWPAIPPTPAAALLAVLGQLAESQFMTADQLAMARRPQLEALMAHAAAQLPFWRKRLKAAGLDPQSGKNAALSLTEWNTRWSALPVLTRAEVQSLDAQLRVAKLPDGHGVVGESVTSGSSGRPVRIARSTLDYFYWQAFQLRDHVWRGRDLAGKFLTILRDDSRQAID
jgi:phenylacetate-CoA ligase